MYESKPKIFASAQIYKKKKKFGPHEAYLPTTIYY